MSIHKCKRKGKQEHWMLAHRGQVNAVMLGVGAAFDFAAGTVSRAPLWVRWGKIFLKAKLKLW